MSNKFSQYLFIIFWVGLIVSTYRDFTMLYIIFILFLLILRILVRKNKSLIKIKFSWWYIFIGYYGMITFIGLMTNYVGIKNLIEFILKYIFLPKIILEILPRNKEDLLKTFLGFKNIIFISAIYGFIEYFMKYNILYKFISIDGASWIEKMNSSTIYQCSSFFLHYNYYGIILIMGWILTLFLPYKNKTIEIIFKVLILEQILICQSRISWIAFIIIMIIRSISNNKITSRKLKSIFIFSMTTLGICMYYPSIIVKFSNFISSRFSNIWLYGFQDGSLGQRLGTLQNWKYYFQENLFKGIFGTGYQSINVEYMNKYSYFAGYSTADCQYTVFLVEIGVVGMVIFLFAVINNLFKKTHSFIITNISKYTFIMFLIEGITLDLVSNNIMLSLIYFVMIGNYLVEKYNNKNMKAKNISETLFYSI